VPLAQDVVRNMAELAQEDTCFFVHSYYRLFQGVPLAGMLAFGVVLGLVIGHCLWGCKK